MAGRIVPKLWRFSSTDERVGILPVVGKLEHFEEVNGIDEIRFKTSEAPEKGDRLVWHDVRDGCWREHVVTRTEEPLGGLASVWAENSICDLLGDYIEEARIADKGADAAMEICLDGTRWTVPSSAQTIARGGCLLYHTNVLAAIRKVCELWDCDLATRVIVADGKVTTRQAWLARGLGEWRGARLTYGKTMAGCKRTVLEDQVYTALYGWGAGIPITTSAGAYTGGYTRKISFADVNDGVKWIGDDDAREIYGIPGADGNLSHRFGEVTFAECEDPDTLMMLTLATLRKVCAPQVVYEVDAARIEGRVPVRLGDVVAVIDTSRDPAWRLKARVARRERTFGERLVEKVVLGTDRKTSYSVTGEATRRTPVLLETSGMTEGGALRALAGQSYLDDVVESYADLSEEEF